MALGCSLFLGPLCVPLQAQVIPATLPAGSVATTGATTTTTQPGTTIVYQPVAPRPIVMSLDGSDLAVRAIGTGIKIACRRLAPLVLFRVVPPDPRLGMFGIALSEQSTERETALTFGWRAAAHPVPTPPIPASTRGRWRGTQRRGSSRSSTGPAPG